VVFVAEENGIDDGELIETESRIVAHLQFYRLCDGPRGAGGREEGIGEHVDAIDFENGSRRADVGDVEFGSHCEGLMGNRIVRSQKRM
jgi:hypothetical protein